MIVVLQFSCNFDMVMEGGEYIYFLCHLDQSLFSYIFKSNNNF